MTSSRLPEGVSEVTKECGCADWIEADGFVSLQIVCAPHMEEAIENSLKALGLTYDELAAQAETEDFVSERARILWDAISPVRRSA